MAKTPKPKPNPTPRSRAAKRALPSSPTTTIPRPDEKPTNEKLAALSARAAGSSGVQKRKGGKALSRQKRRRKEAAMDKAGAVLEKLERRREVSVRKGGVVKGRSTDWDNLNEIIEEEVEMAKAVEGGKEILVK